MALHQWTDATPAGKGSCPAPVPAIVRDTIPVSALALSHFTLLASR